MTTTTSRREIVVIKVGGSLITDRRRYRIPLPRKMDAIARTIATWHALRQPKLVLILGGGAFGHNVVHRHGLEFDGEHRFPCEVFELTAALFELKVLFARALQRSGLACLPLQESSLFVERNGAPELTTPGPVEECFSAGYLPLLTGGLITGTGTGIRPVSSDRIALPLSKAFRVARVAMLTDQPGVMHGGRPIRRIVPSRFDRILSQIAAPTKLDVTDGMRGKVAAAIELSQAGVETVISSGMAMDVDALDGVFSQKPPGTLITTYLTNRRLQH